MCTRNLINKVFYRGLFFMIFASGIAQEAGVPKSTEDLFFLIGKWDVVRTYSPGTDKERVLKGTLVCNTALDGQFVECEYEMQRPGKIRGLDVVYFNYNAIYGLYESVWLSSTWPIKGILQSTLQKNKDEYIMESSGQFKIENDVMEYVKGKLILEVKNNSEFNSFTRFTHIRTSEYEEGVWHHHMTEKVKRIGE